MHPVLPVFLAILASMRYTHTKPRKWTDEDVRQLMTAREAGATDAEIAQSLGRSEISVQIKRKRLSKKTDRYNDPHRSAKYAANSLFLNRVQPRSILDVYAGPTSYYEGRGYKLETNDLKYQGHTYQADASRLCAQLYGSGKMYDVVDLDPFGSAHGCLENAVRIARHGLIISFGEIGHRRWKRLDYVSRTYRIEDMDDFTHQALEEYVMEVAGRFKKEATVFTRITPRNFARSYFLLSPMPKQPPRIK